MLIAESKSSDRGQPIEFLEECFGDAQQAHLFLGLLKKVVLDEQSSEEKLTLSKMVNSSGLKQSL